MATLTMILYVFALVFFLIAAGLWIPPVEPHRVRLVAAGLACWMAAIVFGPLLR